MNKWRLLLFSVLSLLQSASAERNFVDGRDRHRSDTRPSIQDRISDSLHGLRLLNTPYEARDVELTKTPAIRHDKHRQLDPQSPSVRDERLLTDYRRAVESRFRSNAPSARRDYGRRTNERDAIRVDIQRNPIEGTDYPDNFRSTRRDFNKNRSIRGESFRRIDDSHDERVYSRRDEARIFGVELRNNRNLDGYRFVRRESNQRTGNFELKRRVVSQFENRNTIEKSVGGNGDEPSNIRFTLENRNRKEMDYSRLNTPRRQTRSYGVVHIRVGNEQLRNTQNNIREKRTIDTRLTSATRLRRSSSEETVSNHEQLNLRNTQRTTSLTRDRTSAYKADLDIQSRNDVRQRDNQMTGELQRASEIRSTDKIRHVRNVRKDRGTNERTKNVRDEREIEIQHRRKSDQRAINEIQRTHYARKDKLEPTRGIRGINENSFENDELRRIRNSREDRINRIQHQREEMARTEIPLNRRAHIDASVQRTRVLRSTNEIRRVRNALEDRVTSEVRRIAITGEDRRNQVQRNRNSHNEVLRFEIRHNRDTAIDEDQRTCELRSANNIRQVRNACEKRMPSENRHVTEVREEKSREIIYNRNTRDENDRNEYRYNRNTREHVALDDAQRIRKSTNEIRQIRDVPEDRENKVIRRIRQTREERNNQMQLKRNTRENLGLNNAQHTHQSTDKIRQIRNAPKLPNTNGIRRVPIAHEERTNQIQRSRNIREDMARNEIDHIRNIREDTAPEDAQRISKSTNEIRHIRITPDNKVTNVIRRTMDTLEERTNKMQLRRNTREETTRNEILLNRRARGYAVSDDAQRIRQSTNNIRQIRKASELPITSGIRRVTTAREERENHIQRSRNTRDEITRNVVRLNRNIRKNAAPYDAQRISKSTNEIRRKRDTLEERTSQMQLRRSTREETTRNEIRLNRSAPDDAVSDDIQRIRRSINEIQQIRNAPEDRITNRIRRVTTTREERTDQIQRSRNTRHEITRNEVRLNRNIREDVGSGEEQRNRELRSRNEIRQTKNAPEDKVTNIIRRSRDTRSEERTNEMQLRRNTREDITRNEIRPNRNARDDEVQRNRELKLRNEIRQTRIIPERRIISETRPVATVREEVANRIQRNRNTWTEMARNEIRFNHNAPEEVTSDEVKINREVRSTNEIRQFRNAPEDRAINVIRRTRDTRDERINRIQQSRDSRIEIARNEINFNRNTDENTARDKIQRSREIRSNNEIRHTGDTRKERTYRIQRNREEKAMNEFRLNHHARDTNLNEIRDTRQARETNDARHVKISREERTMIQRNSNERSMSKEEKRSSNQIPAMSILQPVIGYTVDVNWQYLLYLLQGIYLCSLFMKMPKEYEELKITRAAGWFATKNILKID